DGRDDGPLQAHGRVVPAAAARLRLEPLVGDVEPTRERDAPVTDQGLAVIAAPELPDAAPAEAGPVIGDRVDTARAQRLEEGRGRLAAPHVVVEEAHGDAARGRRDERGGETPADRVVAEDVHLERDALARRLD